LRDGEYKRLGTVSLLAGLDLHTGRVTEIVSDRHASADFIALLGKLDAEYPAQATIRVLLETKDQLREALEAFIRRHNERAKPFRWRKREVKGGQQYDYQFYAIKH